MPMKRVRFVPKADVTDVMISVGEETLHITGQGKSTTDPNVIAALDESPFLKREATGKKAASDSTDDNTAATAGEETA